MPAPRPPPPCWRREGFRSHHASFPLCSATIAARTRLGAFFQTPRIGAGAGSSLVLLLAGRCYPAKMPLAMFLPGRALLLACNRLALGLPDPAFAFALADFLLGVGNIGFEIAAAADFCSAGAASSSLAPPSWTASTTVLTTAPAAAPAAAPSAVPATVLSASAALLIVLFFAIARPPDALTFYGLPLGVIRSIQKSNQSIVRS